MYSPTLLQSRQCRQGPSLTCCRRVGIKSPSVLMEINVVVSEALSVVTQHGLGNKQREELTPLRSPHCGLLKVRHLISPLCSKSHQMFISAACSTNRGAGLYSVFGKLVKKDDSAGGQTWAVVLCPLSIEATFSSHVNTMLSLFHFIVLKYPVTQRHSDPINAKTPNDNEKTSRC